MIKFLQIAHFLSPGLTYQENIYCKELSKENGLDNYIVSASKLYPKSMGYSNLEKLFPSRDIKPGRYVEEGVKSIRLNPSFEKGFKLWLNGLIKEIKRIQPDVILIHGVTNLSTIRAAAYKIIFNKNIKVLVDDHSINTLSTSFYNKVFKLFLSPLVNKATDYYLPISEETMDIMSSRYGCKGKFKLIRLGADDTLFFRDDEKRNKFRKEYEINDNEHVFLFTGKINSTKGVDIIIDAFAKLRGEHSHIKLFLVGVFDDEYMSYLETLIAEYKIYNHVTYIENVTSESLSEMFNGGDTGLWPFSETISVVEAQLCGLPVVINASDISKHRIGYNTPAPSGYVVTLDKDKKYEDLYLQMKKSLKKNKQNIMIANSIQNSEMYKNTRIIQQLLLVIKNEHS